MPKKVSKKQVLIACQMSFDGKTNRLIADAMGVNEATVSSWRKQEIWQEFEAELIAAYKKEVLKHEGQAPSLEPVTPSEIER